MLLLLHKTQCHEASTGQECQRDPGPNTVQGPKRVVPVCGTSCWGGSSDSGIVRGMFKLSLWRGRNVHLFCQHTAAPVSPEWWLLIKTRYLSQTYGLVHYCVRMLWQRHETFCSISVQLGKYQVPKWGGSSAAAIPGRPLQLHFCIHSKHKMWPHTDGLLLAIFNIYY